MKIVAVLGTYRKDGVSDRAVEIILDEAGKRGAETEKIFLTDHPIGFCANCRACTQNPGEGRGTCAQNDGMDDLLTRIDNADALILASPVNFGTVTAITKRFIERLIVYGYWPWEKAAPRLRQKPGPRKAVLVTSSAAPAIMTRRLTPILKLMKDAVKTMGFTPSGELVVGLAAGKPHSPLGPLTRMKARRLGKRLSAGS